MPVSRRWPAALPVLVAPAVAAADASDAPSFADVGPYSIRAGDRPGLIDRTGRVVPAPEFEAPKLGDGLALVREDGNPVFIDRSGNVVVRPDAERTFPSSDGRAVFVKDRKYGFIDKADTVVVPAAHSCARPYDKGLAFVLDKGRSPYVDAEGNAVRSKP